MELKELLEVKVGSYIELKFFIIMEEEDGH